MKYLLPIPFLFALITFSGCTKQASQPANSFKHTDYPGYWYLVNVSTIKNDQWTTIITGFENGTFYFDDNNNLTYSDGRTKMYGTWSSEYFPYDPDNNSSEHDNLTLQMSSPTSPLSFDVTLSVSSYFDGDTFSGWYQDGANQYSYTFKRR